MVGVAGEGAPWGSHSTSALPCVVWAGLKAGVCSWTEADGQLHVPLAGLPCREMCRLFLGRLLGLVAPASLALRGGDMHAWPFPWVPFSACINTSRLQMHCRFWPFF